MTKMADRIYQFKIELRDIEPMIWRRILVPESYTFWDLHVAIQDAMGWQDYHLHEFRIRKKNSKKPMHIGIPQEDQWEGQPVTQPGWAVKILLHFNEAGTAALYQYDFGDNWEHDVIFEGIMAKEKGVKYPRCIRGERACPPEDVGDYPNFLEVIANPNHEDHEHFLEWIGGRFDPEAFDPEKVKFDNPKTRWRRAFSPPR